MSTRDWDLGGLTDINGNLGKPVPSGQVLVPGKIELDGEAIRWELAGPARWQEISRSTLNEFVKLWESDSASIMRFAKKWGVLAMQSTKAKDTVIYRPCGESQTEGSDPIPAWKYFSRRACAVLNIAAALRQDKLPSMTRRNRTRLHSKSTSTAWVGICFRSLPQIATQSSRAGG
jgi:hypothetical protein